MPQKNPSRGQWFDFSSTSIGLSHLAGNQCSSTAMGIAKAGQLLSKQAGEKSQGVAGETGRLPRPTNPGKETRIAAPCSECLPRPGGEGAQAQYQGMSNSRQARWWGKSGSSGGGRQTGTVVWKKSPFPMGISCKFNLLFSMFMDLKLGL